MMNSPPRTQRPSTPRRLHRRDGFWFDNMLGVIGIVLLLASSGAAAHAAADDGESSEAINDPAGPRVARPYQLMGVVPGVLVHGFGHYLMGRDRAAFGLLGMELSGTTLTVLGGLPLYLSNASGKVVTPATVLLVSGIGLFASSLVMDLVGTVANDPKPRTPPAAPSLLLAEFGGRYVNHPGFNHHAFLVGSVDFRWRRWRVMPSAWVALDSDTWRGQGQVGYRAIGAGAGEDRRDGSSLDITAMATHLALPASRFRAWSLETGLDGRLDFRRLAPDLTFGFTLLQIHYLRTHADYLLAGVPRDVQHQFTVKTGLGFYFGGRGGVFGEAEFYYHHRHDDLVGGIKLSDTGGEGLFGYLGTELRVNIGPTWGLVGRCEFGSALHTGLSLIYRR